MSFSLLARCRLRQPHTVQSMLAALTGIDRHESGFVASGKEAPAKVDIRPGLPNQRG